MENVWAGQPGDHLWMFAVVTVTVCVPFFLLIGSLNSKRGLHFWQRKTKAAWRGMTDFSTWITRKKNKDTEGDDLPTVKSFESQGRSMTLRMRRYSSMQNENDRKAARGVVVNDEVDAREERLRGLETRVSIAAPRAPGLRPTFTGGRITGMLVDERERRRRLTYSEEV